MKEWFSAQELADSRLPGLPATERGVRDRAARLGWDGHPNWARPRAGRGGGLEYHLRVLPADAQFALSAPEAQVHSERPRGHAGPLSATARLAQDARLAIVHAFTRFGAAERLSDRARLQLFCGRYNAGTLAVDDWIREAVPSISPRSLQRWRTAAREGVPASLAVDRGQSRRGTGVLEAAEGGKVREFILALMVHQPHLAPHHVRDQVEAKFGAMLEVRGRRKPIPTVRAFQRQLDGLRATHKVAITKATNPDLYRSTMAPAGTGTYRWVKSPNALWMIDASPIDALCVDGRHSIYVAVDVATRRMTVSVARTPRASAVALLLRKAILSWGVPETIKTDNGSDFVARDTRRLLGSLGIEMDVSRAYSPQEKGHVERAIKTFQHDFVPLLPGFVGHSVADRKAIEERKSFAARLGESDAEAFGVSLTAAALQDYADRWVADVYHQRPHTGLDGASPFEAAATALGTIRKVDERALDLLLMPVAGQDGRRTTTKFGVRIDGYHYQTPAVLPGTAVFVRMDPMDAGRAYCFAADGAEYLGEALCAELRGINPAALQQAARQQQAAIIDRHLQGAKAEIRGLGKTPLIEAALRLAAEKVPNVVALPRRSEVHTTPEIDAAATASRAKPRPAGAPLSGRAAETHAQLVAAFQAEQAGGAREERPTVPPTNVTRLRPTETREQRFKRAEDIEASLAAGEAVPAPDLLWLGGYRDGPEYQAMRRMRDDFGDAMRL